MAHSLCPPLLSAAAALTLSTLVVASAIAQPRAPRLRYDTPADLLHSALRPPENYESTRINASLQIYDFRPAPADILNRFRQTLLRDWIAPDFQEMQLAGPPGFGDVKINGADAAMYAQFAEVPPFGGMPKPRLRIVILARGTAAVIDAQAASLQAWQVALPAFNALITTTRVETAAPTPGPTTDATRALAGLYVGTKPKFISAIGPGIGAGSGGFVRALHMYLLSADGRVYRAYDEIRAPAGDWRRFDFDEAERADPVNSGHYIIRNGQLILTMGERGEETIVSPLRQDGHLVMDTVDYVKQ